MLVQALAQGLGGICYLLGIILVARALLSWFPEAQRYSWARWIYAVSEPIVSRIRRLVPPIGQIDISIMLTVLLLFGLGSVLVST